MPKPSHVHSFLLQPFVLFRPESHSVSALSTAATICCELTGLHRLGCCRMFGPSSGPSFLVANRTSKMAGSGWVFWARQRGRARGNIVLGDDVAVHDAMTQITGKALRISSTKLREANTRQSRTLPRDPELFRGTPNPPPRNLPTRNRDVLLIPGPSALLLSSE